MGACIVLHNLLYDLADHEIPVRRQRVNDADRGGDVQMETEKPNHNMSDSFKAFKRHLFWTLRFFQGWTTRIEKAFAFHGWAQYHMPMKSEFHTTQGNNKQRITPSRPGLCFSPWSNPEYLVSQNSQLFYCSWSLESLDCVPTSRVLDRIQS